MVRGHEGALERTIWVIWRPLLPCSHAATPYGPALRCPHRATLALHITSSACTAPLPPACRTRRCRATTPWRSRLSLRASPCCAAALAVQAGRSQCAQSPCTHACLYTAFGVCTKAALFRLGGSARDAGSPTKNASANVCATACPALQHAIWRLAAARTCSCVYGVQEARQAWHRWHLDKWSARGSVSGLMRQRLAATHLPGHGLQAAAQLPARQARWDARTCQLLGCQLRSSVPAGAVYRAGVRPACATVLPPRSRHGALQHSAVPHTLLVGACKRWPRVHPQTQPEKWRVSRSIHAARSDFHACCHEWLQLAVDV